MGTRIEVASVEAGNRIQLLQDGRYEEQSDLLPAGTVLLIAEVEHEETSDSVRLRIDSGEVLALDGRDVVLLEDD